MIVYLAYRTGARREVELLDIPRSGDLILMGFGVRLRVEEVLWIPKEVELPGHTKGHVTLIVNPEDEINGRN